MGSIDSKCARLVGQLGWPEPELAPDFQSPSLVSFLKDVSLEVSLPGHAPQNDMSEAETKGRKYPRPAFCHEAYKMHLALIGPSSACKRQLVGFLPRLAQTFQGPSARLGPGREAVPHYFFDSDLHRLVLWELPEISFKQHVEDYIREIGLLYIDCCFMLFSEKYLLTDIYCKLCVAMHLHGIPFFVICTQSQDGCDEKQMAKIRGQFQQQSVQVRMFNPSEPHDMLGQLIPDFFKEISWNRGKFDRKRTQGVSDAVLGQTVRLKGLEKKPELNGRCGVLVGKHSDTGRYLIRLTENGVEIEIALRDQSFSVLKPKLLGEVVRIKGLQSRPELNGQYAFVDEFLRVNERYQVWVPDVPNTGLSLALKADNLERADAALNARPLAQAPAASRPKAKTQGKVKAKAKAPPPADAADSTVDSAAAAGSGAGGGAGSTGANRGAFSKNLIPDKPQEPNNFDPPARPKPEQIASQTKSAEEPSVSVSVESVDFKKAGAAWDGPEVDGEPRDLMSRILAAESGVDDEPPDEKSGDLMARILATEESEAKSQGSAEAHYPFATRPVTEDRDAPQAPTASEFVGPFASAAKPPVEIPAEMLREMPAEAPVEAPMEMQLTKAGLLSMRVWAVVGSPNATEDLVDHLMDCGRTVYTVGQPGSGAHFTSASEMNSDPSLPKAEVLCLCEGGAAAVAEAATHAACLGLAGVVLHLGASALGGASSEERCRDRGLACHGANVLVEVKPGAGIPVAPLD